MEVLIASNPKNTHRRRILSAVSLINGCQHYYHLKSCEEGDAICRKGAAVDPESLVTDAETRWPDAYLIVITEDPFTDNWFSHEYLTTAVITTSDWDSHYAPPSLRAYVTYQIAQALLNFAADMTEEITLNMVHEPPEACLYDLCSNKIDIRLGMVAGNICPTCLGQLRSLGTPEAAIDSVLKILAVVRAEALGRPIQMEPREVFVVMRYTNNDENDHAWTYGIKTAIEACGLTALRADTRVESGQLLDKIERSIKRSRLVVAKIDENNLNVYFELGLAMGLDKDVMLVSESKLVLNLPSDLKNWECVTYEQGNYQQLHAAISHFLEQKYHLKPG